MAILAECPVCHNKQTVKNKLCKCGMDLDKAKKGGKVNFWIVYRVPGGIQKKEKVGKKIEEARDAEGKRRGQKRENRIFDIKPEFKTTFKDLSDWYLKLEKVKGMKYYPTLQILTNKFNSEFGAMIVGDIKLADLENLQAKRKKEGFADRTIDEEIGTARTMINKAFDNDKVGGDTLKVFKKVKKMLKRNSNARDKILSLDQFDSLMQNLPLHGKWVLATAFYTGMRKGEILGLTWDKVFLTERCIKLEAKDTKDKEPRRIPIGEELHAILKSIPRALHKNHVFLFKGEPFRDIRGCLTNACEKAGLPYGRFVKGGFVFHDLRHTFNTYMRKSGVSESVIMDITGHSTREMFDRYNTIDEDDRKQAITTFEGFLKAQSQNVENKAAEAGETL